MFVAALGELAGDCLYAFCAPILSFSQWLERNCVPSRDLAFTDIARSQPHKICHSSIFVISESGTGL
jgi:hypothetical protein